ncbi:hypothetical protein NVV93_12420 [Pseudomonas sp. LS44]|uniref:hypothetical protein n=1 Tax=Pseudomonas sp. LS44 TaxID=1357074 RepID=UPI00215AEF91|nr:hypothetical protein [Pseudomonas sp. LS44]UVE16417.1 hypothetical protein NVV93_12420 [Pseudomonas sp. LS44]
MRLLIVEENVFANHDAQLSANALGIFSIHPCCSVQQAQQAAALHDLHFDVAFLRQADDPFNDLLNLEILHTQANAKHLLLLGAYSAQQRKSLQRAAKSRKIPLRGILERPLDSRQMLNALHDIPGFAGFTVAHE